MRSAFVILLCACWAGCSSSTPDADGGLDSQIPDAKSQRPDAATPDTDASSDADASAESPCDETGDIMTRESLCTSTLNLDSARFEFVACIKQGAGATQDFRLVEVRVTDTSDELPEEHRGKTIVLAEDQMVKAIGIDQLPEGKQLIYAANHHNACDSFHVTFPALEASYAATSVAAAGCGGVVGDAPKRTGEDWESGLWYRIKYPGQDWGEKKTHSTRNHFLLSNYIYKCN